MDVQESGGGLLRGRRSGKAGEWSGGLSRAAVQVQGVMQLCNFSPLIKPARAGPPLQPCSPPKLLAQPHLDTPGRLHTTTTARKHFFLF